MELTMRETSCCGAVLYSGLLVLLVACLFGGPVLLSRLALPEFRDYLAEEKHHRLTRCSYLNHTHHGTKTCTYIDVCEDSTCRKEGAYPCMLVTVTTGVTDNNHTTTLYRTYQDAEHTNYKCSAYECENGHLVMTWVQGLVGLEGFPCYYHPDAPEFLYLETATHWRVIALFVGALLMLVLGIWGLMVVMALFTGCKKIVYVLTCCTCCSKYSRSNKVWDRDVEEKEGILAAIEQADLPGVKKLLTKHNVNSPLSRKQLFVIRTTTPLCYTATRGSLDIIKHLVTLGADVHYKNDAGHTLLHCACASLSCDVVNYCLTSVNCDSMVNCRDIYGCTPMILLAKSAKAECSANHIVEIAKTLVSHGAHASWKCNDGCTALHYAIVNSQRHLTSYLVKAGCVDNTPKIDGTRTPLTALLLVKDAPNLKLMIEAGVQPCKDAQLQEVMRTASGLDPDLCDLIQTELRCVSSLTRACRAVIRTTVWKPNLQLQLEQLRYPDGTPVPLGIRRLLQMEQL